MLLVGVCWEGASAVVLVVGGAVHPICRHYTPSDRVHRDVTGVPRRNGCSRDAPEANKQQGGTQAVRLGPLPLLYERGAIIAWVL